MATVFSNRRQCAHVWAQQNQERGRAGNVSFEGDTLYSYGTPVARIVNGRRGAVACLVTSRSYSVTTSAHVSGALQAFGYERMHFAVPSLGRSQGRNYEAPHGRYGRYHPEIDHAANLDRLMASYAEERARLTRARSYVTEDCLRTRANKVSEYASLFGFKRAVDVEADLRAMDTPKRRARIARQAERDNARRAADSARWAEQALVNALGRDERIQEWRSGAAVSLRYGDEGADGAMLRIKGDTVQTSQGAEVPLSHVALAFRKVEACRAAGVEWRRNGESVQLGAFQLDRITAEGDVRAGCHAIAWAETEALARSQGWVK